MENIILDDKNNNNNEVFQFLEKKFTIDELISENEITKYYRAYNKVLGKKICLKIIDTKELKKGNYDYFLKQIQKEEQIINSFNDDDESNIMAFSEKYEISNYIIYELEYFEMTLDQYIKKHGPIKKNASIFIKILRGIANALRVMNLRDLIHRDIKPSNIFLIKNSDCFEAKLGGFGCSIYKHENINDSVGSLYYTAPEIIKNLPYDEKCDLWSFGIVFYELLFGYLPYGKNVTPKLIKEIIFSQDNLFFGNTGIPNLNTLFKGLLTVNRKNRIDFNKFYGIKNDINSFDYIFKFKEPINKYIGNVSSAHEKEEEYDVIKRKYNLKLDSKENLSKEEYKTKDFILNKIMNIIEGEIIPSIIDFSNSNNNLNEAPKFNNVLYYDENLDFIEEIYKYCYIFEKYTNGAFILCTNLKSLKILKKEIIRQNKKDNGIYFNLITSGSKCKIVLDYINEDKDFQKYIHNVCIYCKELEKYQHLKNLYPLIHDDIYNRAKDVVTFIEKYSTPDNKPFPISQLVTFNKYKKIYKDRHLKICEFYGDFNPEIYEKSFKNLILLIDEESKKNGLKKKDQNKLKKSFKTFDIFHLGPKKEDNYTDILDLDKLLIKEYTKNTFYADLNKWLINFQENSYEAIAYFTSRLMYSLNSYAKDKKMFYTKNNQTLYRGIKLPYSSLLPYERAKGKIILFSSFTSTSESIFYAKRFSGRDNSKELYQANNLFSVIFLIENKWENNWISNGINIEYVSKYKKEKEILFQPFSFYLVKDVNIDLENYTADIYLDTVGKTEILEENLKNNSEIVYNKSKNTIEIINYLSTV